MFSNRNDGITVARGEWFTRLLLYFSDKTDLLFVVCLSIHFGLGLLVDSIGIFPTFVVVSIFLLLLEVKLILNSSIEEDELVVAL